MGGWHDTRAGATQRGGWQMCWGDFMASHVCQNPPACVFSTFRSQCATCHLNGFWNSLFFSSRYKSSLASVFLKALCIFIIHLSRAFSFPLSKY